MSFWRNSPAGNIVSECRDQSSGKQIISKVGAGDSMVAGITLSLARGKPLRESVLFGVAAGTAAVMTPGTELCRREDAERLFESMASDL